MAPPDLRAVAGTALDPCDAATMTDPAYERRGVTVNALPYALHYCQRYAMGRWFFSKYKLREDLFDNCTAPLLREPPADVAEIYDWNLFPNGVEMVDFSIPDPGMPAWKKEARKTTRLRHGWMLCAVVLGINEALEYFKADSCGDPSAHPEFFQKTWHFHKEEAFQNSLEHPKGSSPFQNKASLNHDN
jgi:hypothetical protein